MLRFWIAFKFLVILVSTRVTSEEQFVRRIAIKIREDYQDTTLKTLSKYDFKLLYKITPQTYILEYQGSGRSSDLDILLKQLKNRYHDQILDIERVQIFNDTVKPEFRTQNLNVSAREDCLECGNYYGMGVPDVWSLGYTGKGVVIAVTDVGIHTDLIDLRNNINSDLCYNFIDDSKNVTPEFFHNFQEKASQFSSHGDHCASLIVAEFGNGVCASGIAFKAKAVGLKVFTVTLYKETFPELKPTFLTGSDILARALVHNISEIDIFANAWAPTKRFSPLTMEMEDAIEYGARTGRNGLGRIYVVPTGPAGNGLANNIHTIAVNGVGRFGTIPQDSFVSASVITSGLSEGSNISSEYMYTTTRKNKCVTNFKGVSPATAQVASIIALALEANPSLTLRDIQHLLVQSSGYNGLDETYAFRRNGAGRYYHQFFGFGLLNATKLVTLAKTRQKVLDRSEIHLEHMTKRISEDGHSLEYMFCHSCTDVSKQPCLTAIEHVAISLEFETYTRQLEMDLTSPSGTRSLFMKETRRLKRRISGQLVSVNFWDELPFGEWTFTVKSSPLLRGSSQTNVTRISMKLFGTNAIKKNFKSHKCGINVEYKYHQTNRPIQQDQPLNILGADKSIYLAVIVIFFFLAATVVARECKTIYCNKIDYKTCLIVK
ncbi:proprotein convertase subtilisin/kexin type 4-like [Mercenaria mercenaria]|uniref:proprotein convertase subtilisin/kexin type 4-like n=1 Tax=Mercenaria mercenaria TaxID=6596 RepID=UPI00234F7DBB|nr:proprotein convertase subtilisin/kexin type 4-like [Mercenaria mercenaria]